MATLVALRTKGAIATFCAIGAAMIGCDSSGATAPSPASLQSCASGWYLDPASAKCGTACLEKPPNAECAQTDCTERGFVGYRNDGTVISGRVSYSATAGTMSTVADITKQTYAIESSGIRYTPPGTVLAASCSQGAITVNYISFQRASGGWSGALDGAMTSGQTHWKGLAVTP